MAGKALSPAILLGLFFLGSSLFLCCCSSSSSHGSADKETHHVVEVQSLLPFGRICSSSEAAAATNHTGLKLAHRYNPCTASSSRRRPSFPSLLLQDESRAEYLRHLRRRPITTTASRLRPSQTSLPARSGRPLGTANYVVTIGLGTPKKDYNVIFDTGSDLTWVQCKPCVSACYSQQDPIFDPSLSTSYSNVTCSAPECAALKSPTGNTPGCNAGATCVYGIQYGDSSYSVGFFARDTLTLSADAVPGFLFGCGQKNSGLFGKAAGLLGLGRDPVSIVSQAAAKYGRAFSYCLPTPASTGYLTMGGASSGAVQYTPMITDPALPSFYFLDLVGIKVGGRQLPISAAVFKTAGTLIDSGTVITRLPPNAYAPLRAAFRQGMMRYPTAPAVSILDTCYDLGGYSTVSIPVVELLFGGGASVRTVAPGVMVKAAASQWCLTFAPNSDPGDVGIIGNMQQMTVRVVYDLGKGQIGFGAGGCS